LRSIVPVNHASITAVAICGLVTIRAVGALVYTLAILGLGPPAPTRLRRSNSILVLLRFPGISSIGVVSSRAFAIVTFDAAVCVRIAARERARRKHQQS
jgi:hypothetical protein